MHAGAGPFPSEPRVYHLSIYGNQTMSSSIRQQALFDGAADGRAANDNACIDQVDSATDEEEGLLSDLDDDVFFDRFDDLRVEDEDWEIAERGLAFSFSFFFYPYFFLFSFGRLYQTVQSTSATRRRTIPQRLREDNPHFSDKICCCPSPRNQPTNNYKHSHRSFEEGQDR